MSARTIRVALLGCGTVGAAVARLLIDSRERLRFVHGIDVVLTRILVRDVRRPRDGVDPALFTADWRDVLRDRPQVVIEALGGREPAATFVKQALERGISVVSANKTLIAHDGPALDAIAQSCIRGRAQTGLRLCAGSRLAFEASVGAAVPVLAALRQRQGDPIIALRAVLNGTCNFILTRMSESGLPLNDVLQEAIARGLAEPDPTADVSGRDTAEKLAVLARAAGFRHIAPADITTTGIENITPRDLQGARERGCVVRLIAELEVIDGTLNLRVGPAFVPTTHPLAKAKGADNVIVLDQEFAGRLVLHGEGAGPSPTAAAILGDLLNMIGAADARSPTASPSPSRRSAERVFVRASRGHQAASVLRQYASHIEVRPDSVEAIVCDHNAIDADGAFVATMLA